jgi:hypothetical protein
MDLSSSLVTLGSFIDSQTNEDNVRNGREARGEGVRCVAKKEILDKLSIYIPQKKMEERPVERLIRLGEKRDRSINYLVVDAILQYLQREEKKP